MDRHPGNWHLMLEPTPPHSAHTHTRSCDHRCMWGRHVPPRPVSSSDTGRQLTVRSWRWAVQLEKGSQVESTVQYFKMLVFALNRRKIQSIKYIYCNPRCSAFVQCIVIIISAHNVHNSLAPSLLAICSWPTDVVVSPKPTGLWTDGRVAICRPGRCDRTAVIGNSSLMMVMKGLVRSIP